MPVEFNHYRCGVCGWIIQGSFWLCHWARLHTRFTIPFTITLTEPSIFKTLVGYDYVNLGEVILGELGLNRVNKKPVKLLTPKLVIAYHNKKVKENKKLKKG